MKKPTLLTLFLIVFIDLVGFGLVMPVLQFIKGTSGVEAGILFSAFSVMQFAMAPFWGGLSDRFGRRPILLISLAGSAVSYFLFAMAGSYGWMLVSRILAGVCGANISVATAYIADITDLKNRAKGMGVIGASFGLGFIFGPVIGAILSHYGGITAVGLGASAICLANFVLAFFILPESLPPEKRRSELSIRPSLLFDGWDRALRSPEIVRILSISFLLNLCFIIWETTFGRLLSILPAFHYEKNEFYLILIYVGLISAVVQGGPIGKIANRVGEKRLLFTGALFISIVSVFLPIASGLTILLTLLFFWALGMSFCRPIMSSLISKEAAAGEQGAISGVSQSVASLTRIIGPLLGGFLIDLSCPIPYRVIGIAAFLALLMALTLRTEKPEPRTAEEGV